LLIIIVIITDAVGDQGAHQCGNGGASWCGCLGCAARLPATAGVVCVVMCACVENSYSILQRSTTYAEMEEHFGDDSWAEGGREGGRDGRE